MALPHGVIGGLEVAAVEIGVVEGLGLDVPRELLPDRLKGVPVARQVQGQGRVVVKVIGDQFGQADGVEQSGGDPAGERGADAGDDGKSRPQRVAGGGVGIERQGVETEIGEPVTGEMVGIGRAGREYQPFRRHPPPLGLMAQVAGRGIV